MLRVIFVIQSYHNVAKKRNGIILMGADFTKVQAAWANSLLKIDDYFNLTSEENDIPKYILYKLAKR
jgi:hypothetical protein